MTKKQEARASILDEIKKQLQSVGIDLDALTCEAEMSSPLKVVCMASSLRDSVDAMAGATRDQVLMVRVDADTLETLDAWVETGAVKSRSEAAALFIREGLKVREEELSNLEGALKDVDKARSRLQKKAREVLGT